MSIIKSLYNGKINPIEEVIPQDEKYRPLTKQIADERAYFASRLSVEDRERFEHWNKLIFEYEKMTEYANFSYCLYTKLRNEQVRTRTNNNPPSR